MNLAVSDHSKLTFPSRLVSRVFLDADKFEWRLEVYCLGCQAAKVGNDFLVTYSAEARALVTSNLLDSVGFDGRRLVNMSQGFGELSQSYSIQKKLPLNRLVETGNRFAAGVEVKFIEIFSKQWKRERVSELVQNLEFCSFMSFDPKFELRARG